MTDEQYQEATELRQQKADVISLLEGISKGALIQPCLTYRTGKCIPIGIIPNSTAEAVATLVLADLQKALIKITAELEAL